MAQPSKTANSKLTPRESLNQIQAKTKACDMEQTAYAQQLEILLGDRSEEDKVGLLRLVQAGLVKLGVGTAEGSDIVNASTFYCGRALSCPTLNKRIAAIKKEVRDHCMTH